MLVNYAYNWKLRDLPGQRVVGEEEPEAEDGLGKDIKDGVADDLSVDIDVAGSVGNTPDAVSG